jgi:hypothetical protein
VQEVFLAGLKKLIEYHRRGFVPSSQRLGRVVVFDVLLRSGRGAAELAEGKTEAIPAEEVFREIREEIG